MATVITRACTWDNNAPGGENSRLPLRPHSGVTRKDLFKKNKGQENQVWHNCYPGAFYYISELGFCTFMTFYVTRNAPLSRNFSLESRRNQDNPEFAICYSSYQHGVKTVHYVVIVGYCVSLKSHANSIEQRLYICCFCYLQVWAMLMMMMSNIHFHLALPTKQMEHCLVVSDIIPISKFRLPR